jgi:hypothetical protein
MRFLNGRAFAALACLLALTGIAGAQTPPAPSAAPPQPAATPQPPPPADGASIDSIVKALYDGVSHAPGKDGDWTRLRTIFLPGARLTPPKRPGGEFTYLSAEEFIDRVSKGIAARSAPGGGGDKGFVEREVARRTDCFGNVCQIFSTYESRYTAADAKPFVRGINSIQLVKDGNRCWVANVVWDQEAPEKPIPPAYLPKS